MTSPMFPIRLQVDDGRIQLRGTHGSLAASTLPPRLGGVVGGAEALSFVATATREGRIGPLAGAITCEEALDRGCTVTRESFRSHDGVTAAVRMSVRNDSSAALELLALTPVYAETLRAAGADLADWRIVRAGRQKNDVPGSFRFTDDGIDLEHALIDAAEFKAGSGVQASDLARRGPGTVVQADPYLWIKNRRDESLPALFVGVVGQTEHLTQIYLQVSEDRSAFHSLAITCEYDGVLLQPGETRTTHWIVFWEDADEESLRRRHVDLVASLMDVPKPKPPISYYCSWYFYGTDFTQTDLDENLVGLKAHPIPFDVMLIDNGWMDDFGSYNANRRFPRGMKHAADVIRAAGYQPGIWTCPFVIMKHSPALKKYPNLIARDGEGDPILFPYEKGKEFVVDPTSPDAPAYFAELFGKLRDWGFTAHKFDFLRAITSNPRIRFHDRSLNRAQAYRQGMAMFRRLLGDDAYILACGGLFEASAGLVDGMRVGSDTKGRWSDPNATNSYHRMGYVVRVKQNAFRNHTNRLWHTDPDALQLRCRSTPFRDRPEFFHLCEGSFTDDEALSLVAHQYIGGGIVCLCERMAELPDRRYRLLRRALPAATSPAQIVDFGSPQCPTTFVTRGKGFATLVVFNWEDLPVEREVPLSHAFAGESRLAVMELATQTYLGVRSGQADVHLTIPRHGCRVLRVAPWNGHSPLLLGTDAHLSGGAAELAMLDIGATGVAGISKWPWQMPFRIAVGLPIDGELQVRHATVPAGAYKFDLPYDAADAPAPPRRQPLTEANLR